MGKWTLWRFAPYIVFLIVCYLLFAVSTDDPFITFRYAANLLAGHGPSFNPGERVEGFTSTLHLFVSAVLLLIFPSIGILFKAKLASILFGFLTIYQTKPLGRQCGLRDRECLIVQLLLAANLSFCVTSVNALETSLFCFALVCVGRVVLREIRKGLTWKSACLGSVLYLIRPEALLVVTVLGAVAWWEGRSDPRLKRCAFLWMAVFAGCIALITTVRFSYFGYPFPNTFYAKSVPLGASQIAGIRYLIRPMTGVYSGLKMGNTSGAIIALLLGAIFWSLTFIGAYIWRKRFAGKLCAVIALALIFFTLKVGGDWMPGWRFMVAAMPFMIVLQVTALRHLAIMMKKLPAFKSFRSHAMNAAYGFAIAASALAVVTTRTYSWAQIRHATSDAALLAASGGLVSNWGALQVEIGDYLRDRLPGGARIAYSEMGYATYINMNKYFLDVRGLTDSEIAHLPDSFKGNAGVGSDDWTVPGDPLYEILVRRDPEYIISTTMGPEPEDVILERYKWVFTFKPGSYMYKRDPLLGTKQPIPAAK